MNEPTFRDGRIVRSEEPLNLEMPFEKLDGFITPTDSFYVRTHFPIPPIDKAKWRLRVEGKVDNPLEIDYAALIKLRSRTIVATLECAGNSRNFLQPKVNGVQWGLGAVGNAEWTGVPLSILLDRADVRDGAIEVILQGADEGPSKDPNRPAGKVQFARSIPLSKASEVILAYKMNGEELEPPHGFPLRAIVPGWYAMASIKWLQRVIVTDKRFRGYYQTLDYAYWSEQNGLPELTPLSEMQLKAEIAFPAPGSTVAKDSTIRIYGAAWGGDIAKVEVSVDGGQEWKAAALLDEAQPHAWRRWEFEWKTPDRPGRQILIARATDAQGRSQPAQHDPNRGTYMITHLLPIEVEVR